jgi:CcmD family protein
MEALGYLVAAYGAVVLGVGGYVAWLALRAHRVRAALALLEAPRDDWRGGDGAA